MTYHNMWKKDARSSIINYVKFHPEASKIMKIMNGENVTLYKVGNMAVVSSDDYEFLLKKNGKENATNFILDCIFKGLDSYEILEFHTMSEKLSELYDELKKSTNFEIKPSNSDIRTISSYSEDGKLITKFNKRNGRIVSKVYAHEDGLSNPSKLQKKLIINLRKGCKEDTKVLENNVDKSRLSRSQPSVDLKTSSIKKSRKRSGKEWATHRDKERKHSFRQKRINTTTDALVKEWEMKTPVMGTQKVFLTKGLTSPNQPDKIEKEMTSHEVIYIPPEIMLKAVHDTEDGSFHWKNEKSQFHSPGVGIPSVMFPNGVMLFHKEGVLHRENGPAIEFWDSPDKNEWWFAGSQVSYEEYVECVLGSAINQNKNVRNVREDLSNWFSDQSDSRSDREKCTNTEKHMATAHKVTPRKPKVRKVTKKYEFTELGPAEVESLKEVFRQHKDHLLKFKPEIAEAAKEAKIRKGVYEEETTPPGNQEAVEAESDDMSDDTVKVRSAPDLSGTRVSQVKNGFKFGFKKGLINNSSQLLSQKLVSYSPLEGNEWAERFVQISILVGLAELFRRMPESVASKIKLTEEMRLNLSSILRYTSGENIGRDLVDIAANVMPLFAEVLQNVTTEQLEELTASFALEEDAEEEAEVDFESDEQIDVSDLFSSEVVEEKVQIHQEVEA